MQDYEISFLGAIVTNENGLTDVAKSFCVVLRKLGVEVDLTARYDVSLPAADPSSFIPFDSITKEILIEWIENNAPGQLDLLKADLESQYQEYLASIAPPPEQVFYSKQFNF